MDHVRPGVSVCFWTIANDTRGRVLGGFVHIIFGHSRYGALDLKTQRSWMKEAVFVGINSHNESAKMKIASQLSRIAGSSC